MAKQNKGFTLLEIILVMGVIAILASLLIPKSALFRGMAGDAGVEANLHTVEALVTQMIYDWDSGGYRYTSDSNGAHLLETDLIAQINPGGIAADSDLENPISKARGIAPATTSGGQVASFSGEAVAYVSGGSGSNEWPLKLQALKGTVGVQAFADGGKLKVKLVSYDYNGDRFNNEIIIVRH